MASEALSIVTIGGLALLFIMYFGRSFCQAGAPGGSGGPFCFNGFNQGAFGLAPGSSPISNIISGGGGGNNCQFVSANKVCWFGAGGVTPSCTIFDPKKSDAKSASGRNTLCSRVRAKFVAEHKASNYAMAYFGDRLSVA